MEARTGQLLQIRPRPPARTSRTTPLIEAAAAAPTLAARGGIELLELPCRKIINRCDSERVPFQWSINPYRGCEFGCRYCYARYTHEYMGLENPALFETRIFAKTNAPEALEAELPPGKILSGGIAIGTVTDPYQPAERKLFVTRRLLEAFARREGLEISITTKSDLVTRDLELLLEIGRRNKIGVHVTITTFNRRLARLLEPKAPRPAKRIEAVRMLSAAGVETGVLIMPVLPGITDKPAALEAIVAAAARAGAASVGHQVLFLRGSAKKSFYPFMTENFPRQAPLYRRSYSGNVYYAAEYRKSLRALMEALKKRHGFVSRGTAGAHSRKESPDRGAPPDGKTARYASTLSARLRSPRPAAQLALGF